MAMKDKLLELDTDRAITSVGNAYSESEINWGVANPNQGIGTKLKLQIVVKEAFDSTEEDATLQFAIIHGAATAPSDVLWTFDVIAEADLPKGLVIEYPWPEKHLQYTRIRSIVAVHDFTAGIIDAHVVAGQ